MARVRVEIVMEAQVPVDLAEARGAALETVMRLSESQLEVMVWWAAYLLELAEMALPEAKVLPALEKATAARMGIAQEGLIRPGKFP